MEIKLSGKLTAEDLEDIGHLVRSKWYWPRLLLRNLYGLFLFGGLLWITVAGLVNHEHLNWRGVGAIWAIVLSLLLFLYFREKKARGRQLTEMEVALPDWITLTAVGLSFDGPNGASSFQPWASYKRWREGKRTLIVDYALHKGFAMLPVSGLSESERQVLRGLLDSHLPSTGKD